MKMSSTGATFSADSGFSIWIKQYPYKFDRKKSIRKGRHLLRYFGARRHRSAEPDTNTWGTRGTTRSSLIQLPIRPSCSKH